MNSGFIIESVDEDAEYLFFEKSHHGGIKVTHCEDFIDHDEDGAEYENVREHHEFYLGKDRLRELYIWLQEVFYEDVKQDGM